MSVSDYKFDESAYVPDLDDILYTEVDGEIISYATYRDRLRRHKKGYSVEFFMEWYKEIFGYYPKELYRFK